jgi:hypothetical protein
MLSSKQGKTWKAVPNNVQMGGYANVQIGAVQLHIFTFAHMHIKFAYGSVHYHHSAL